MEVLGEDLSNISYEQVGYLYLYELLKRLQLVISLIIIKVKDLVFLESCVRETLRLRPPIMTMMRMAKTPQVLMGQNVLLVNFYFS